MFRLPLASLQDLNEQFMPDVAQIKRATIVETGDGRTTTWSTASSVACRVQRLGRASAEAVGATGGIEAIGQFEVVMPAGTDVTPKDRILVGSRQFEVLAVLAKSYEAARAAMCREIL